jgi:hypothetical protein
MRSPEQFSGPEAARGRVLRELSESSAKPPEGFETIDKALESLKNPGDTISGKMEDGIGEWKVTRGVTEADLTIQSGGEYDKEAA